jgi:hypothetical protein
MEIISSDMNTIVVILTNVLFLGVNIVSPLMEAINGGILHSIWDDTTFTAEIAPCFI